MTIFNCTCQAGGGKPHCHQAVTMFGCTCEAGGSDPHCHPAGDTPEDTPRTVGVRQCVYLRTGCNVDHVLIATRVEAGTVR